MRSSLNELRLFVKTLLESEQSSAALPMEVMLKDTISGRLTKGVIVSATKTQLTIEVHYSDDNVVTKKFNRSKGVMLGAGTSRAERWAGTLKVPYQVLDALTAAGV